MTVSRRIAQGESASIHTEEVAAFKSCSAYHSSPDILFLSHCVPNPPDKGEKIRAHFLFRHLASRFRIHLACFGRGHADAASARELEPHCASVHVEPLHAKLALARAAARFCAGQSLMEAFYQSSGMTRHVLRLARRHRFAATVCFSSAMAQYAPPSVPLWMDMVDVDSEKWLDYARLRRPAVAYRIEAARLRRVEREWAARARCTYVTTEQERSLLEGFTPGSRVKCVENGVDFEYFNPAGAAARPRPLLVFLGAMDYYPNADACCWFASEVFPHLRACMPDIEFSVVGRNPGQRIQALARQDGIVVTGAVPDVRPYLAAARAVVAPLRIARGIQNKALESLAMGKQVLASGPVCAAFGAKLPEGVIRCESARDYLQTVSSQMLESAGWSARIRDGARQRFSWERSMRVISTDIENAEPAPASELRAATR